jgi:ankyrin repeat protein
MNFDLAALDLAIANLENASTATSKSNRELLAGIVTHILQAGNDDRSNANITDDVSGYFDRLTELAIAGNLEIFTQLLAAEQHSRKPDQPTLLIAAVMAGKTEIIRALISAGASVNDRMQGFFTVDAMEFAVDGEYLEIVRILITAGANLNWQGPMLHPVTKAISKDNIELLHILIDGGANVSFQTGYSLVAEAAEKGNPDIIRVLAAAGCDLNTVSVRGTPLVNACLHGRDEIVECLLSLGADPNLPREDGLLPTIAVFSIPEIIEAMSGWVDNLKTDRVTERMTRIIELLLDAGADPNSYGFMGQTALTIASARGYLPIVRLLIRGGAKVNAIEDFDRGIVHILLKGSEAKIAETVCQKTALIYAIEQGRTEVVAELLSTGADLNIADKNNRLPIDIAIQEGHTEIIQLLQNSGANSTDKSIDSSPAALLGAAKQGNLDILRSALAARVDPNTSELDNSSRNSRYPTALMFAVDRGHLNIVEQLIDAGANVNLSDRPGKKLGKTPLMCAAESGRTEIAKLLLESGAIVEFQNKRGETALYYAVVEKHVEIVRILLEAGADPHKKNWEFTPFEMAEYSTREIAALVTNLDPDKNSQSSKTARERMLLSAAFGGDIGIVRDLISQNVDIDVCEHDGWTALMYAAAKGNLDTIQVLLAAGADPLLRNRDEKTAREISIENGHGEAASVIRLASDRNNRHLE